MSRDTDEHGETAREYIEVERDQWSGLYDANGDKLYRQKQPIGYRIEKPAPPPMRQVWKP